MHEALQVHMLGTFSLTLGDQHIHCDINRSKRVWLLLAYIIYNRRRVITPNELIDLFWNDEKERANPTGALKTTLHRVRATLDMLSPDAGKSMIRFANGGYSWNDEIGIVTDIETFESLCLAAPLHEADGGLARLCEAIALYRGEFLNKLSSDTWTLPIATYYGNLYLQSLQKLLPLLMEAEKYEQATATCRTALGIEPYQEFVYQYLMRSLLAMGDRQAAIDVYENLSKLLLANFSVIPSPESRELYREALRIDNHYSVPLGMLTDQLREVGPIRGAMICDYDFFKMFYQAEARLIARSGYAVHIALITLSAACGKTLSRRSLDYAMDNLQEHLRMGLRKGDIISRCSPSQFVIMLSGSNYENSCMVCERFILSFERQYPHSPARVDYAVQPLLPQTGAPTDPAN